MEKTEMLAGRSRAGHGPTMDSDALAEAYDLARAAHSGQERKDGSPFIGHPQAVSETLAEAGFGEDVIVAAVLHDIVEHTDVGLEAIEPRFGTRVGELVTVLTEDESISGYLERKRAQRRQVEEAGRDAIAIFASDKLANLRDIRRAYALKGESVSALYEAGLDARVQLWREDLEMASRAAPDLPYLRDFRYQLESFEEIRAEAAGS